MKYKKADIALKYSAIVQENLAGSTTKHTILRSKIEWLEGLYWSMLAIENYDDKV